MDPHSWAPKKNTSHGNVVLPQDTTHLIQRPCYQRGSPCQDPAGNRTTWRSPDDRKKMQTAVVRSCLPFIRSGQNHLARHSERGKKIRQTEGEVGRQPQGIDRPGVLQVPEGSGEQGNVEKTGRKIICGAPTTLSVKGLMMMMMTQNIPLLSLGKSTFSPAAPAGIRVFESNSPESTLCADFQSVSVPHPCYRSGSWKTQAIDSAKSAGGRLHLNTYTLWPNEVGVG